MKELQSGTAKLKEDFDPFFDDPASLFNRQLSELKCGDKMPTLEDHNIFYMLNDACELGGYHVLSTKGPEMIFEDELNYAEFACLSHEETEELKQIANQIKNNFDKIFKEFYSRTWH